MDLTTVIVLVLIAIAGVFLVFFERNSRQNEARLKAEAEAKATVTPQSNLVPETRTKPQAIKKSS